MLEATRPLGTRSLLSTRELRCAAARPEHVPIVEALERSDEDAAVQAFVAVVVSTVERLAARLGADFDGPRAVSGGDLLMSAGVY